jgi:hypothetical protein
MDLVVPPAAISGCVAAEQGDAEAIIRAIETAT